MKYQTGKSLKQANCLSSEFFCLSLSVSWGSMITVEAIKMSKKQHISLGTALTTYHFQRTQIHWLVILKPSDVKG